ncbi:hypothetical protein [Turicibacter sp. TJ11]|uniref:hypothetical protein n=1 Tax=Turicibacter sp. TJ11 TaxID=2806443 RepID=UPI001F260671|nr:hypothetical protein [Turicibacter sp. TJ11]
MEIKTKHKKFKNFTELYEFMSESHLEEISVTIKYPDKTKSAGIMPIDMVLSFKSIEEIKTLDQELKTLATEFNEDLIKIREVAETYNEMNYFDDEEGELQTQLDNIEITPELKEAIHQLVTQKLHA